MDDISNCPPLTRDSVIEAAKLIEKYIHRTPVHTSTTLTTFASTPQSPEDLVGTEWQGEEPARPKIRLFFKCENYQKIGAFKARGAFHAISKLTPDQRSKGVMTHSSGDLKDCSLQSYS
jgi:threonine dehydratase